LTAQGFVHLWQRRSNHANTFIAEPITALTERCAEQRFEIDNGLPVDLFCRQQSYSNKWGKAGKSGWVPVRQLRSVAIDIDCHKLAEPVLPELGVQLALQRAAEIGLPPPNHVDYSGNGHDGGFYLRWLLQPIDLQTSPDKFGDVELWKSTTLALLDRFGWLGADRQAQELNRWLRIPGSINTKYSHLRNGAPSFRDTCHRDRIPLDELAAPLSIRRAPPHPNRIQRHPSDKHGSARLSDGAARHAGAGGVVHPHKRAIGVLEQLQRLRGGIREGHRNQALYIYMCLMAGSSLAEAEKRQGATQFASGFRPPLPDSEVGRTIDSGLQAKPRRITYRRLIDWLGITEAEKAALGIEAHPPKRDGSGKIIEANRAYHRQRDRVLQQRSRRRRGVRTKAESNRATREQIERRNREAVAAALAEAGYAQGAPYRLSDLRAATGLSEKTIRRLLPHVIQARQEQ